MNAVVTAASRLFNALSNPSAISNTAIASELRSLADRLELSGSQVVAIGALVAVQLGENKFEAFRMGHPIPDIRDGVLITDTEARVVRVDYE